jgi:hypothetical protein
MPRNLTDLMETAVATAPPEPHLASDITRLAQRHQRRRTTFVAAGAALAVVAVTGVGLGLARGGSGGSTPEPAGSYKYGQVVDPGDAVPATDVPGFRELRYAVKAVDEQPQTRREDNLGVPNPAFAEYTDIDAEGRLVVRRRAAGDTSPIVGDVLAGPSSTTSSAQSPPQATSGGPLPIDWLPGFVGDGRLLWVPNAPVVRQGDVGIHVTDLTGGQDVPLVLDHSQPGPPTANGQGVWVAGDRLWFTNMQFSQTDLKAPQTYALYSTPLDDPSKVTVVAEHTIGAAVSEGTLGWVTADGRGFLGSTDGGPIHSFPLPLDESCIVSRFAGEFGGVAVAAGLLAFTEECGSGDSRANRVLVVDGSGRLILEVHTVSAVDFAMSDGILAFEGSDQSTPKVFRAFRADLRTGALAELGVEGSAIKGVKVAGSYIVWHDRDSFHVGEFTG